MESILTFFCVICFAYGHVLGCSGALLVLDPCLTFFRAFPSKPPLVCVCLLCCFILFLSCRETVYCLMSLAKQLSERIWWHAMLPLLCHRYPCKLCVALKLSWNATRVVRSFCCHQYVYTPSENLRFSMAEDTSRSRSLLSGRRYLVILTFSIRKRTSFNRQQSWILAEIYLGCRVCFRQWRREIWFLRHLEKKAHPFNSQEMLF